MDTRHPFVSAMKCLFLSFHSEDVDADCVDVYVPEFLHHHGHVPLNAFLRIHRGHLVWNGQIWTGCQQVSRLFFLLREKTIFWASDMQTFDLLSTVWWFFFEL